MHKAMVESANLITWKRTLSQAVRKNKIGKKKNYAEDGGAI